MPFLLLSQGEVCLSLTLISTNEIFYKLPIKYSQDSLKYFIIKYSIIKYFTDCSPPRKELQGYSVRVVNVLPGWVDTEGLRKALQDEKQASVMADLGLGEVENLRDSRNHMLRPEDVAETVWDVINKPSNVYINDIMIKDRLQSL